MTLSTGGSIREDDVAEPNVVGPGDHDHTTAPTSAVELGAIVDGRLLVLGQMDLTDLPADSAEDAFLSELLSVYVDGLMMDLLLPLPSRSAPGVEMPFLERLCIASGEEEYHCYRRYGE